MELRGDSRHVGSLQRGREQHGLTTPGTVGSNVNQPPSGGQQTNLPTQQGQTNIPSSGIQYPSGQAFPPSSSNIPSSGQTYPLSGQTFSGSGNIRPSGQTYPLGSSNIPPSGGQGQVSGGMGESNIPYGTRYTAVSQPRVTSEDVKSSAYSTYQEGIKTLQGVKDLGSNVLCNTLGYFFPNSPEPLSTLCAFTSLKIGETKHFISNLSNLPLETSHSLVCTAAKNLCERTELLKRWSIDHKIDRNMWEKKSCSNKFLCRDKEWVFAVQRFVDLKLKTSHCYQDAFDEAIRDYAFAVQKLDRAKLRVEEYERLKDKIEPVTYAKTKCQLSWKRKCAENKFICAKMRVEDLRHRILHFYQDCADVIQETLEFATQRVPDIEGCLKNVGEEQTCRQEVDNLLRHYGEVRDLLNEASKCCKDKINEFGVKRDIENWMEQRRIFVKNQPAGTQ